MGFEPTTNGLKVQCANQAAPQGPFERSGVVGAATGVGVGSARINEMFRRSLLVPVVVALAAVSACGEIVEPEGFSAVSTTSTPIGGAADGPLSVDESGATASSSPVTTDFVPVREPDYVPEVLISADNGVLAWGPDALRQLDGSLAGVATDRVVDDLAGGLVLQRAAEEPEDEDDDEATATDETESFTEVADVDGEVLWYPAEGGAPTTIDDSGARLLDVGYVSGSPSAVVLVGQNRIDRIRLVDNQRTPMIVFEDGQEVLDLSASGSFHALVLGNERCGDLRFYQADGTRVFFSGPGEPDCIVPRRPAYGAVALSPDGGAVVYTEVTYREDGIEVATELVARDLTSDSEYYRRRIGEDGDRIVALTFDGQRVAFLRQSADGPAVVVLGVNDGEETSVDLPPTPTIESVSFARLRLTGS